MSLRKNVTKNNTRTYPTLCDILNILNILSILNILNNLNFTPYI